MRVLAFAAIVTAASAMGSAPSGCPALYEKYFSIDMAHGLCGEACFNPTEVKNFGETTLSKFTKARVDAPCKKQDAVYDETVTQQVGTAINATLDIYKMGTQGEVTAFASLVTPKAYSFFAWGSSCDSCGGNDCAFDGGCQYEGSGCATTGTCCCEFRRPALSGEAARRHPDAVA